MTELNKDDHEELMGNRHRSPVSTSEKIMRVIWAGVQMVFFRCSFHTWNAWRRMILRLFGAKVGKRCIIRRTVRVYYPWKFEIGDDSCLGDKVEVYNLGKISIGNRVLISQEAYLCAGTHDYRLAEMPLVTKPIVVGDDAWVCARAFVSPGVELGEGVVVGAAAMVLKNVPAWTIVGGNPAVKIKDRPKLITSK